MAASSTWDFSGLLCKLTELKAMTRTFEIVTPIDGTAEEAWAVLIDFASYTQWNRLVPFGQGAPQPGSQLELRLRGRPGRFRPTVVSVVPSCELVLEDSLGHRSLAHLTHSFTFLPAATETGVLLRQQWVARGVLVPVVWPLLRRDMARFAEFGCDLNRRVGELRELRVKP
jgi:hypothetical protein